LNNRYTGAFIVVGDDEPLSRITEFAAPYAP
jgi:hypothetical protein